MEKLYVLGTGYALATKCYNTCFAIRRGGDTLLVDAGGGNGILSQMEKAGLSFADVHHMIVTHAHCDHVLGVTWVIRKIGTMMLGGKYDGTLTIYCHESVMEGVVAMAKFTLQKKFVKLLGDRIRFELIGDGHAAQLGPWPVTFFDIRSTKLLQYGFTMQLEDGRKLACLGDEPYNPDCEAYVAGSDWMLCEAFCLYGDRDVFKPYEKHHSTVKEACELASQLKIPHVVLWHTEDKNYENRKALYTAEGKGFYSGDLYVPDDLEVIDLK